MRWPPLSRFAFFATGLFFASVAPLLSYADYPYTATLQTIRPILLPVDEENPGEGHWAFRTSSSVQNVWSFQRSRFVIDGEELQQNTSIRYSVSDRLQFGASMPVVAQGGGIFDRTIEGVHRALGVGQSYRDAYPRDRINVSYEPYGALYPLEDGNALITWMRNYDSRTYPRVPYDPPLPWNTGLERPAAPLPAWGLAMLQNDPVAYYRSLQEKRGQFQQGVSEVIAASGEDRIAAGNPRIFGQAVIWRGPIIDQVSIGLQFKVPMHAVSLMSTPGWDGSAFLNVRSEMGQVALVAGASWTRYSMTQAFSVPLPRDSAAFRMGVELRSRSGESGVWFSEYVYFTRPFLLPGDLSKPGQLISIGYRHHWHDLRLCYLFAENFGNYGVTPDAGLMFSAEARL